MSPDYQRILREAMQSDGAREYLNSLLWEREKYQAEYALNRIAMERLFDLSYAELERMCATDEQIDSGWFNWVKRLWPWKRKMALPPNAQAGDWVPEAGDWVAVQIDGKFVASVFVRRNANREETLIAVVLASPVVLRVLEEQTAIRKRPVVIPGKLVNILTD